MISAPSPSLSRPRAGTPWRRLWREYRRSWLALGALGLLVLILAAAVLAPWITPQNPYDLMQLDVLDARLAPGSASGGGAGPASYTYWLGTDGQGRDLFSGIVYGLRISLLVGVGSALIAGIVGTLVGLLSAYAGGAVDALLMRLVDLLLSFPSVLMALMILAYLGKGVGNVVLTLVILEWAYYARTVRGQALVESRKEYVDAARGQAISPYWIALRHLLPNCLAPVIVVGTLQVARAITLEATLSFLGLGVPITSPSLGLLIANGFQYMLANEYWISLFPGLALLLTIVSINLVGDRLREILNPRAQR